MRCDMLSAVAAGVSCQQFYQRQAQLARRVDAIRGDLRALGAAIRSLGAAAAGRDARNQATSARLNRYMGAGAASEYSRIAMVHDVLLNAERELRSTAAPVIFVRDLDADGRAELGHILLRPTYSDNTLLHEAIHFGTHPVRRRGNVAYVRDGGNISYLGYGRREAALERARRGWRSTSISAASYSWVVTGE